MDVLDGETVYNSHDESHVVMSEKVQSMAGSIYQEFERMISRYDEDVVKDLMPLVVNILEWLDFAYTENQEHEVEVELLREDNEQLVTQYEREKQLRKASEQKLLELEDGMEEEKKKCQSRVETLESIVRMLELKNRNSSDHATRMEDKSEEIKKEYGKLHDRYTELFKTHMDYMERTKILMGTDRLDQLGGAPGMGHTVHSTHFDQPSLQIISTCIFGFSSFDPYKSTTSPVDMFRSFNGSEQVTSLMNKMRAQVAPQVPLVQTDKHQAKDGIDQAVGDTEKEGGWVDGFSPESEVVSSPEMEDLEDISMDTSLGPHHIPPGKMARPTTTQQKEERTGNTLYQEIHFQEPDALAEKDEGADFTDSGSEEERPASPPYAVTDNFFGMGKVVEILIMENNELLATKNALNIVKDDLIAKVDELTSEQEILREEIKSLNAVKSRLRLRIAELSESAGQEEAEKAAKAGKSDDEEDVPMAQRKRFTRVEMARVLMERNQYKERFMELQEAVRWTEMIRATRTDPATDKKNKQTIWKFFSNLFSTSEKPQRKPLPYGNVRYNAPAHQVTPALDTMRRRNLSDHRRKGLEIFDAGFSSEKLQQRRATERREQYKQVRAHVKKDDGRMQAYGWSLPAKTGQRAIEGGPAAAPAAATAASQPPRASAAASSHIPVPVPVYCRPLMEKEPGMKIWCAAGVNLTGGRTRDGGNIVGASVFYSGETETTHVRPSDEIDRLDQELNEGERERREGELLEQSLSSLVWICTSTHSISKVTVIDANNPADILESFHVCSSHLLCIASVPGAKESDYEVDDDINKASEESLNNNSCSTSSTASSISRREEHRRVEGKEAEEAFDGTSLISCDAGVGHNTIPRPPRFSRGNGRDKPVLRRETISCTDPDQDADHAGMGGEEEEDTPPRRLLREPQGLVKDGVEEAQPTEESSNVVTEEVEKMSSVLSTMWLGSQSGSIYVHSAVRHWKRCLHSIKLKDSVLSIVHIKGRVLAALADGTVAIFQRRGDGQWDLNNYHLLDLGKPHHSIRCMQVVHGRVWCGYRNKIHVVDPKHMTIEKSFDAHPRKESQVRQMAWLGDGVWVSIRLDSTLRLYHAHTHQHLQDVDIEPYVSKMLGTGKLGFSFVRITALLISSHRLWIGTGNGVIISVLLSETQPQGGSKPGGIIRVYTTAVVIRVYTDSRDQLTPGSFAPYCSMAQAQLSFHGHRDAVKFFVAVPGSGGYNALTAAPAASALRAIAGRDGEDGASEGRQDGQLRPKSMLVISGGEGYIDFRIGEGEDDGAAPDPAAESLSRGDRSHLIVWSVARPPF
uniref:JNK-interacting protein 3 n=1 Tax=Eriocheir sinensis TaxID=95602 RepID=A0A141HTV4_ERISI|nr:C-jun-amino-terminal kinase-interacting protein 4 [Eriocheir sinensis]